MGPLTPLSSLSGAGVQAWSLLAALISSQLPHFFPFPAALLTSLCSAAKNNMGNVSRVLLESCPWLWEVLALPCSRGCHGTLAPQAEPFTPLTTLGEACGASVTFTDALPIPEDFPEL